MVLILKFWYLQRIYIIFLSFSLLNLNKNFWGSSIQLNLTTLSISRLYISFVYTIHNIFRTKHTCRLNLLCIPSSIFKHKNITAPNMQHILFLHCWIITKNVPLSYSDSVMSLCWMYLGNNLQNVSSSFPHQCILKLKKKQYLL